MSLQFAPPPYKSSERVAHLCSNDALRYNGVKSFNSPSKYQPRAELTGADRQALTAQVPPIIPILTPNLGEASEADPDLRVPHLHETRSNPHLTKKRPTPTYPRQPRYSVCVNTAIQLPIKGSKKRVQACTNTSHGGPTGRHPNPKKTSCLQRQF
jgi:hypothetical protein